MMVIVAVATVLFVMAGARPLRRRARRERRERRLMQQEVARGIAGLEMMLAAHAPGGAARPGLRDGDGATGQNPESPAR
jgi:hypothetical protein